MARPIELGQLGPIELAQLGPIESAGLTRFDWIEPISLDGAERTQLD